jgi:hypothetical protein
MKTVGQLLIFAGIVAGFDCVAMCCIQGLAGAAICVIVILVGALLIRRSKPKS